MLNNSHKGSGGRKSPKRNLLIALSEKLIGPHTKKAKPSGLGPHNKRPERDGTTLSN